ncbi:MAG: ABC transporter permease, partial [Vicinamibacterales bacterium]
IGLQDQRAISQTWRFPELLPPLAHLPAFAGVNVSPRIVEALVTSLLLATATGLASTILGFIVARSAARGSRRTRLATLALALFAVVAPPIALGVGLQVAMLSVGLSGTLAGVWLAHLVPAIGYLTLFADGVFTTFDFAIDDEARTLGASSWQVLSRLTVPILKDRLGEGIVLGGLVSWGQLAITALIGGGLVRTLPVELMAFVRAGDDRLGAAAGLVLTLPPLLAIGLLQVGRRRPGASL